MLNKYNLKVTNVLPPLEEMDENTIYFSDKHQRSVHLCPCKCGERVLLSHFRGGWRYYITTDGEMSISTLIKNQVCNTNYIIREGYAFRGTW